MKFKILTILPSLSNALMVMITYRFNPEHLLDITKIWVIKEVHFWMSDNKDHHTLFVQKYFVTHWEWLLDREDIPKQHCVFLDGCAGQYKSCRAMYFVARYSTIINGCQMSWDFNGTGHRKGTPFLAGLLIAASTVWRLHNPWSFLECFPTCLCSVVMLASLYDPYMRLFLAKGYFVLFCLISFQLLIISIACSKFYHGRGMEWRKNNSQNAPEKWTKINPDR